MQKIKIFVIIIISLITVNTAYSQAGISAVPFLLITPDARANAMGNTGTALADDLNAIYWNPAGLGFFDYFDPPYGYDPDKELDPYQQISLSYSPWLPQFNAGLSYGNLSYGRFFERFNGTLAGNFIFMNLGEFDQTNESGQLQGTFRSNEFVIGLSYGTIIAPDLSAGIQLKYIQSNLTPTSNNVGGGNAGSGISFAFDFGLLWKPVNLPLFEDRLSLGLNLQNIGPKVTYLREADPIPTQIRFGIATMLVEDEFNRLTWTVDLGKLLVFRDEAGSDPLPTSLYTAWKQPGVEFSTGFEWWYQEIIAFRGGVFVEPKNIGDRKFGTFGLGIKYDMFNLDFGYIVTFEDNHPLANTMRFTLMIDINRM